MQHVEDMTRRTIEPSLSAPTQLVEADRGKRSDEGKPGRERKRPTLQASSVSSLVCKARVSSWTRACVRVHSITSGTDFALAKFWAKAKAEITFRCAPFISQAR